MFKILVHARETHVNLIVIISSLSLAFSYRFNEFFNVTTKQNETNIYKKCDIFGLSVSVSKIGEIICVFFIENLKLIDDDLRFITYLINN